MDALRGLLTRWGVRHCVAFVIGGRARGREASLERWLEAGYELGNHTFDHLHASHSEPDAFLDSVARCDALLASLGAFDAGRPRWFRYPFLDRGPDAGARRALAARLRDLGYAPVHASVDLYDHRYEAPLAAAEAGGDTARAARILGRYQEVAWRSVRFGAARSRAHAGRAVALIPFFHFGRVSERGLAGVLERLDAAGAVWCAVAEAVADPLYREFDAAYERRGLIVRSYPTPLGVRLGRGLARLSERLGCFGQRRNGPRWPYLI
jgi:peptidoglycan/xylan/chitin deacetylase (PgdA/CDA1 family)